MRGRKELLAGIAIIFGTIAGSSYTNAEPSNSAGLRNAVKLVNVRDHQKALHDIAEANNGTRASGTAGFAASAQYVKQKLKAAGYTVTEQTFIFPFYQENSPAELSVVSPIIKIYGNGPDFGTLQYSGSGEVTAVVQPVDMSNPPAPTSLSTSGCEAADFAGFVPGNIALIQRGTCTFGTKAANAAAAGASAVIIFNNGVPGRTANFNGTLGGPVSLPALSASFAVGVELSTLAGPTVRIKTDTISDNLPTSNVIAETARGRSDRVVVVGAHLDSVIAGPGINDNGSGTAGILEIAIQMAKTNIRPVNKVRFIWFGAEEAGLLGSRHYVSQLSPAETGDIALNLNFDMIGSPNFVRFIYDGDGSDTFPAGPSGSAAIEQVFQDYFDSKGLATAPTAFSGRSDYGPFIAVGIPAGGLFTGAEGLKSASEAEVYGGTAGIAYDPCYHQACDTFANNSDVALNQMSDAAADAVMQFAMRFPGIIPPTQRTSRMQSAVALDSQLYLGSHLQR